MRTVGEEQEVESTSAHAAPWLPARTLSVKSTREGRDSYTMSAPVGVRASVLGACGSFASTCSFLEFVLVGLVIVRNVEIVELAVVHRGS